MKISELIEKLTQIRENDGDLEVAVQYRDMGGDYYGTDKDLYLKKEGCFVVL